MLGGFGPSIIGTIFILRNTDKKERKNLWSRIFDPRRIGWPWLLASLLIYPAIFLISVLMILPFGGTWPEAEPLMAMLMGVGPFVLNTIIILLLGPVSEEVGWRGYALEKLQSHWSPMKATLVIGVIWWAWHLPLFFMPSTLHGSQGLFSFFTIGYFFTVVSYSVLFTWLYNNTKQSILVTILAHFSINYTIGTLSPFDGTLFIITTVLLLILGIGLFLKDKRLGMGNS
jgi:membrane protease YdiL (CAAX protease family)